jgi:hypothetical protein
VSKASEKTRRIRARKFRTGILSTKIGMAAVKAKPVCNPGQDIHAAAKFVISDETRHPAQNQLIAAIGSEPFWQPLV